MLNLAKTLVFSYNLVLFSKKAHFIWTYIFYLLTSKYYYNFYKNINIQYVYVFLMNIYTVTFFKIDLVHFYYISKILKFFTLVFYCFFFYTMLLILLENSIYWNVGFSCMPKKYKLFTVLRAPHNYGSSKEHFHLVSYKSSFEYPIILSVTNATLIKKIFNIQGNCAIIITSAVKVL